MLGEKRGNEWQGKAVRLVMAVSRKKGMVMKRRERGIDWLAWLAMIMTALVLLVSARAIGQKGNAEGQIPPPRSSWLPDPILVPILTRQPIKLPEKIKVGRRKPAQQNHMCDKEFYSKDYIGALIKKDEPDPCQPIIDIDEVDFYYYVEHVLPNEWNPDWPIESLKAGAMAVKTYAWYWIARGGKWRQYGHDADLCDSVASQLYRDNISEETLEKVRPAINETWNVVMLKDGKLFESGYWSGTGNYEEDTKSNGKRMTQYGSKFLADEGKKYQDILKHFYWDIEFRSVGDDIGILSAYPSPSSVNAGGLITIYIYDGEEQSKDLNETTIRRKP